MKVRFENYLRQTKAALADTEFLTALIRQRVYEQADIYLHCGQGYFSGSAWMEV